MPSFRFTRWKAAACAAGVSIALGLTLSRAQPVLAQLVGAPPKVDFPAISDGQATATTPQPIQVQALDATHFVVATREVRLVQPTSAGDGRWQQMLVTVVTHYSVVGGTGGYRLVPIEHVRVPAGYRAYGPR